MHTNNFIKKLLGFKDVSITNIINNQKCLEIFLETKKKTHICSQCNSITTRVHDYRIQRIKDIPLSLKPTLSLKNVDIVVISVVRDFMKTLNFYPVVIELQTDYLCMLLMNYQIIIAY